MYVVYQLVNEKGQVEYIGHTKNPNTRLINHTCVNGKFVGRTDLILQIIKSGFRKRYRAFEYECKLQKELGFQTDKEKSSKFCKSIQQLGTDSRKVGIIAYDLQGNKLGEFSSILEASIKLNINHSLIHNVITGKQKSTKNLVFYRKNNPKNTLNSSIGKIYPKNR
jgi:predicted GIY-YIG superfamily endonuclease